MLAFSPTASTSDSFSPLFSFSFALSLHSSPHLIYFPLFGSVPFVASSPVHSVIVLLMESRSLPFSFFLNFCLFFLSYFVSFLFSFHVSSLLPPLLSTLFSPSFFSFYSHLLFAETLFIPIKFLISLSSLLLPLYYSSSFLLPPSLLVFFSWLFLFLHNLSAFLSISCLFFVTSPQLLSFFLCILLFCSFPILRSKMNSSATIHFLL